VALTAALLLWKGHGYLRLGARPTELEHDAGLVYRIDLNQARRAELRQLPGVGPGLADRIEQYRNRHGGFRSVDELLQVGGIGPTTLERLRPWVCVGTEEEDGDRPAAPAARKADSSPLTGKRGRDLQGVKIDINRDSPPELQKLPGIGPKLSQRIVEARARQAFRSVDDLRRVPGIGPKTLERLRPYVTVGGAK
jgi:competence protein ComEA